MLIEGLLGEIAGTSYLSLRDVGGSPDLLIDGLLFKIGCKSYLESELCKGREIC